MIYSSLEEKKLSGIIQSKRKFIIIAFVLFIVGFLINLSYYTYFGNQTDKYLNTKSVLKEDFNNLINHEVDKENFSHDIKNIEKISVKMQENINKIDCKRIDENRLNECTNLKSNITNLNYSIKTISKQYKKDDQINVTSEKALSQFSKSIENLKRLLGEQYI